MIYFVYNSSIMKHNRNKLVLQQEERRDYLNLSNKYIYILLLILVTIYNIFIAGKYNGETQYYFAKLKPSTTL